MSSIEQKKQLELIYTILCDDVRLEVGLEEDFPSDEILELGRRQIRNVLRVAELVDCDVGDGLIAGGMRPRVLHFRLQSPASNEVLEPLRVVRA